MAVAVKRCRWQLRIFRAARIANGAGIAVHADTVFTILHVLQGAGQSDRCNLRGYRFHDTPVPRCGSVRPAPLFPPHTRTFASRRVREAAATSRIDRCGPRAPPICSAPLEKNADLCGAPAACNASRPCPTPVLSAEPGVYDPVEWSVSRSIRGTRAALAEMASRTAH